MSESIKEEELASTMKSYSNKVERYKLQTDLSITETTYTTKWRNKMNTDHPNQHHDRERLQTVYWMTEWLINRISF